MPRDRLRSPRAGHGRKIEALSDFEFRVWDQFQLSADCFGVLRYGPHKLREDNKRLAKASEAEVVAALERLAEVGLVKKFTDQDEAFLCDPTWQDFQKIDYPYTTLLPKPPSSTLLDCTPATRKLFRKHPGGRSSTDRKTISKRSSDSCEGANGYRQSADGTRRKANSSDPDLKTVFESRFWPAYPRKVAKAAALAAFLKAMPDDGLLTAMLGTLGWQSALPEWHDPQYIPHPATWLNKQRWKDEPAPAVGRAAKVDPVPSNVRRLCESAQIGALSIAEWFKGAELCGVQLVIPDPEARGWIERNYLPKLRAVSDGLELSAAPPGDGR